MSLGQQIRNTRKKQGLSAEGLADLLGISKDKIYKWETGTKPSDAAELLKIQSWLSNDLENVPQETNLPILQEDAAPFHRKGSVSEKYIGILERDRDLFEHSLKNNLNLITANLTELLKAQRYDRAQLTTLLAVTSKTLATVQKRDVNTVFEETNKAVNDLIRQQM